MGDVRQAYADRGQFVDVGIAEENAIAMASGIAKVLLEKEGVTVIGACDIDPNKIATCGFSAGGHLALAAGVKGENKPNAMILGYPAVTTPNHPMSNFMVKLLAGKKEVTDEDCAE